MNRETKIGLLTGLFVIILVGVLLSEYLGGADRAPKQAVLVDVGADYRNRTLTAIGAPEVDRQTGQILNTAGGREDQLPMASAATPGSIAVMPMSTDAELIRQREEQERLTVQAQQLRQQQLAAADKGRGNILTPADPSVTFVAGEKGGVIQVPAKSGPTTHVIAKGDTLGKIAYQYFGSSKSSFVAKIVAANPDMLKDAKSNLIIGKKLVIPGTQADTASATLPTTPIGASAGAAKTDDRVPPPTAGNVPGLPQINPTSGHAVASKPVGSETKTSDKKAADKKETPAATAKPGKYVVEKGDTFGVIAKKVYGSSKAAYVKLIADANKGVKSESLKVGQELRIPEKSAK